MTQTNVEKLESLGILGDVRERLGAEDENDTSKDERINHMTPDRLVTEWCGWEIGDPIWWSKMKGYFDFLTTNVELEDVDDEKLLAQYDQARVNLGLSSSFDQTLVDKISELKNEIILRMKS